MIRQLKRTLLSLVGDTQPRTAIDEEVVGDYERAYEAGATLPPVVVFFDGTDHWLADGFHRWHASGSAGLEKIPCDVRNGTRDNARWYSYSANQTHGLRRSNADKRKAVLAALRHPKGAGMSNRQIAEHVGVDEGTVRRYRESLSATAEIPQSDSRVGRDGRKTNTANCGKGRGKTKPPEEPEEVATTTEDMDVVIMASPEQDSPPGGKVRGVGVFRANEAIDALKRIPRNDPLWARGFEIVADWIKTQTRKE